MYFASIQQWIKVQRLLYDCYVMKLLKATVGMISYSFSRHVQ